MSKKTFFKRIAVSAIAALGLGMLSVAPSQAVAGVPTLTVTAGSASITTGGGQETATAAKLNVVGLLTQAPDTYSVNFVRKSAPTGGAEDAQFHVALLETTTAATTRVLRSANGATDYANKGANKYGVAYESAAIGTAYWLAPTVGNTGEYVGATFGVMLDSGTARTSMDGTYVFTAIVTPYSGATQGTPVTADVTFVINKTAQAAALANGTIAPSLSTAYLDAGTDVPEADGTNVTALATSSTTTRATLAVRTYTSASLQAPESVTVTITGPGLVGTSATGVWGKSIKVAADGATNFLIRADGTAGTASIVVSTTTVTFPAKTMTFYAAAASTASATTVRPVIGLGSTDDVVYATLKDASGNIWAGDAYIYAATAADALIAGSNETPVACTWTASAQRHQCPVSGHTAGTANLKVIDAEEVADATATSDAVSVRVSTGIATTAVLSFDKATYSPGEKAQLRVQVLDGAGLPMKGGDITNGLAAGGISTNKSFGANSSNSLTNTTLAVSGVSSATADLNAGHVTYVVYMPMDAGVVTVSATGGTGLAAAGQVAITASATVVKASDPEVVAAQAAAEAASDAALEAIDAANAATDAANLAAEAADAATVAAEEARDAADAATAAVEALASEVATLMAALDAQLKTLAKTVAKIAKKVKA